MKKCPFIYFSYFFVNFISHSDARDENGDKNVAKYSSNIDTVSEDLFVSYFFTDSSLLILASITSRCSGNEQALLSENTGGRNKTRPKRAAEIEPILIFHLHFNFTFGSIPLLVSSDVFLISLTFLVWIFFLNLIRMRSGANCLSWDYTIHRGPATWASSYPAAAGKKQSPIDIQTAGVRYDPNLSQTPLHLLYMKDSDYTITNNGHSVQVSRSSGSGYQLSGGPLLHKYQFKQFHFHWGASDDHGSEHQVNGKSYAAELHLVHWNVDLFDSFESAVTQEDGLAVIGVFIEVCEDCPQMIPIFDLLPRIKHKDDKYRMKTPFDPSVLIPCTEDYWTYSGSLTTPPCSESVTWIVLKETITIPSKHMEMLRSLHGYPFWQKPGANIVDNFRPVMPLNGRIIRSSFS